MSGLTPPMWLIRLAIVTDAKNILYVANAINMADGERLVVAKVGVAQDYTGERIITLNSTKMPIRVELDSAWTFEHDTIDAYQA